MRKRIPNRVCSCTPKKGIVQMESRLLVTMVNREMRRIKCWKDLKHMAYRAMNIGNVCFNTGHPYWAIRVWRDVSTSIACTDYDEWRYADWNDRWYNLDNLTAETEAAALADRSIAAWRWLGHQEMADWERFAKGMYDDLWEDKYGTDRNEPGPEDEIPDSSIAVFNDGLPYWKPLSVEYIYTLFD